ncbi:RNA polymerase sigma factor [Daejeonella sp.]|jgi:RNA polymerase sigma-70 factor (ECF subfamily)|uniref:RNA polymerase sigma factor n=1 Tax=Daejeonella sp. TaxID=2805397 RepID=UPI0037850718
MQITEDYTDSELWISFKSGDKTALKTIYYRYYMMLYRFGLKKSSSSELVEDCLQDLFLKIWKNRDTLGDAVVIKSYLYRAYIRILFDAIKKSERTYKGVDLDFESSESSFEERIIKNDSLNESNILLDKALQHLTKRQKQVVNLYYFEGMPYKQIAEVLPMKYQAIRNCVHEALKVLRKNMESRPL